MGEPSDVYYFGCWREPGHYLFRAEGVTAHGDERLLPWDAIDGALPPAERRGPRRAGGHPDVLREAPQGHAALHYRDGWTAVSFWDRSVDKRGGCNSNFFIRGIHSWEDAVRIAKASYPRTWARYPFEVVLVRTPSGMPSGEVMTLEQKAAACDRFRDKVTELETRLAEAEAGLAEASRTASAPCSSASGTRPSSP